MINEFKIDWRQRVREDIINRIENPEIASDQVKEISTDDESNDKNDELQQESIGFKEIITIIDKMKQFLSLIMIAKVCLRLQKGLRTFN